MSASLWHNVRRRMNEKKIQVKIQVKEEGERGFIYLHSKSTTIKIRNVP
jgi:hypothetical protein